MDTIPDNTCNDKLQHLSNVLLWHISNYMQPRYIPLSDRCNTIAFNLNLLKTTTRAWEIKVWTHIRGSLRWQRKQRKVNSFCFRWRNMIRHRTRDSCHHLDVSNGYTDQHLVSAPADDIPSNLLMFCYSRQDTELQLQGHLFHSLIKVREHLPEEKLISFGHCPNYLSPLPPNRASCTTFFGRQKRRFCAYYRTK